MRQSRWKRSKSKGFLTVLCVALLSAGCGQRVQWLDATIASGILAVSDNGYICGYINKNNLIYTYRQRLFSTEPPQFLGTDRETTNLISFLATDMSSDGNTIVGIEFITRRYCTWCPRSGIVPLELPPSYTFGTSKLYTSNDGTSIVGTLVYIDRKISVNTACLWKNSKVYDIGLDIAQRYITSKFPGESDLYRDITKRAVFYRKPYQGNTDTKMGEMLWRYEEKYTTQVETTATGISPCGKFITLLFSAKTTAEIPKFRVESSEDVRFLGYDSRVVEHEQYTLLIMIEGEQFVELARLRTATKVHISRGAKRIFANQVVYEYDGQRVKHLGFSPAFTPLGLFRDTHEVYGLYSDINGTTYVKLNPNGNIKPIGKILLPAGSHGIESIRLVSSSGRYIIANVHTGYREEILPFQADPKDIPVPVPVSLPTYALAVFDTAPTPPAPSKKPQTTQKPSATKAGASQPKQATNSSRATQPKKPAPSRSQRSGSPPKKNTTPKRR